MIQQPQGLGHNGNMKKVSLNTEKIKAFLAQKIAEYWDGKTVTVSGGVGAHWSDFAYYEREREVTDPETGEVTTETYQQRDRVPGTHDKVTAIVGTIHATANGTSITFNIDYQVTIANVE